jgi:hypothetical protein
VETKPKDCDETPARGRAAPAKAILRATAASSAEARSNPVYIKRPYLITFVFIRQARATRGPQHAELVCGIGMLSTLQRAQ